MAEPLLIGIDLGGTKIEGAIASTAGVIQFCERILTPKDDYAGTLQAIDALVKRLELGLPEQLRGALNIGIGVPGSLCPASGLMQNANSTWINGRPFSRDLETALGRPVRVANDANCFALSEAMDGSGAGHRVVFGVILGTGCGGGIVIGGRSLDGPRGIGGEWGHNPLPWMTEQEFPGPRCWCGRLGCMETWVSGPGLAADHQRVTGVGLSAELIVAAAKSGNAAATATLARHADRLARGLASVVNVIDPDIIVLGGGLSNLTHLYEQLPRLMAQHIFADDASVRIVPPKWGDASGVRGAAWLWR